MRTLTKRGNNYLLRMEDNENKLITEKIYTKEQLKDVYRGLKMQQSRNGIQRAEVIKNLSKLDVKDTPKLRDFIETLEAAQKLQQKQKLEDQLKLVEADTKTFDDQLKEVKTAIPEIGRMSKK